MTHLWVRDLGRVARHGHNKLRIPRLLPVNKVNIFFLPTFGFFHLALKGLVLTATLTFSSSAILNSEVSY